MEFAGIGNIGPLTIDPAVDINSNPGRSLDGDRPFLRVGFGGISGLLVLPLSRFGLAGTQEWAVAPVREFVTVLQLENPRNQRF